MEEAVMQQPPTNPLNENDGGGVRGLSTLYILKALMDRLNQELQAANLPPKKPCEVFDLIGGTSTGGLIAIMLGRLEMDLDESIKAYSELMGKVFADRSSRFPLSLTTKARFDSAKLESVIKAVIRKCGISESELFNDSRYRGCKTFVCTAANETTAIKRLRSYSLAGHQDVPATICEAALATSAATSFFEPAQIGNRKYVDGALGANNPVDEVEGEASDIWCPETGDLKPLVKCFISIGTGNPGKKAIESTMLKFFSKTLVAIATETEKTADRFVARWRQHYDESRYFRFNVHQGLQGVGLEECREQGTIEAVTDDYLEQQEQKFYFRDCVRNLKQKQNRTGIGFSSIINEYKLIAFRTAPRRACWSVPFVRNQRFVGRNTQLIHLEGKLFLAGQCPKIAIVGLGGVGKTQVTLELAYRIKDQHPGCSVFWVPAISVESMWQSFLDIGRQLQVPGLEDGKADTMKLVQQFMCQESAGQWLLILDNADDIDMWFQSPTDATEDVPLVDYLPRGGNGSIIFTTRSRKVAVKLAPRNWVVVEEMDEEVATELLRNSLDSQEILEDHEAAKELLKWLTHLPLAIVQAAAYINENDMGLAEYLSLLNDKEENIIELLQEDFEDEGRYRGAKNPVATTWLISFEQIRNRDSLAADYLSFMSCLDPKAIPESLLPPAKSMKKLVEAIGTLSAYSFITKRPANKSFDLHRLVHLATRNWLREEGSLIQWTRRVLTRLADVFPDGRYQDRAVWRTFLPHARHVLESSPHESIEKRLVLLQKFGLCLFRDGRYGEAEKPFMEVMNARKRVLGQEHPGALPSMANLASALWSQGRWKEAEELFAQAVKTGKRTLGGEHPDTLSNMTSLASTFLSQGRWREAEEQFLEVVETSSRALGREHPDTLTSVANLASTYRRQGRWGEAEQLFIQVVEVRKRVLGREHPDTLSSMSSLAMTHGKQGRWREAEELEAQVMETKKKVLGEEHPNTLASMASLASMRGKQGRQKEAEELFVHVAEARKRVLGQGHPNTLASMANLASSYRRQGRWKEAEELEVQVMDTSSKVLGQEHPDTLSSMASLASTFWNQGRWREAEELFVQVTEASSRVLGLEHPDTLTRAADLASTYRRQGRWKESEKLEMQTMETRKKVLGQEHPDTLTSMSNLAVTYGKQGRFKEAEELGLQAMGTSSRIVGPEHPDTLIRTANLASTYRRQGRWKEAEELGVQATQAEKRVLGQNHPNTLTGMAGLASTYEGQGRWKEAEQLALQVMEARKKTLGQEHPDTLSSISGLASIYWKQGQFKEAEELFTQATEIGKRVLGEEHPDTLTSMHNLAITLKSLNRQGEAIQLMSDVSMQREQVLGPDHPDTKSSAEAMSNWLEPSSCHLAAG